MNFTKTCNGSMKTIRTYERRISMSGEFIAFILLSGMAILGGILLLNFKKVIHMMLAVILTFLSLAGLYVLLHAEFVAVVQVLIYSGAIAIIMIFAIMLTKH